MVADEGMVLCLFLVLGLCLWWDHNLYAMLLQSPVKYNNMCKEVKIIYNCKLEVE